MLFSSLDLLLVAMYQISSDSVAKEGKRWSAKRLQSRWERQLCVE